MYDELVKQLREAPNDWYDADLHYEAADAIEKLSNAGSAYGRGWTLGYDAGREESKPRWISVTERLPEERTDVLAMTADCDIYVCDFIPSVRQFWTIPGDDLHIDDITHWMPLPPPKEE